MTPRNISIRINQKLYDRLKRVAPLEDRSVSSVVRHATDWYLNMKEKELKLKPE